MITPIIQAIAAENAVLSAICIRDSIIDEIEEILKPSDFYYQSNRVIYAAMLEISRHKEDGQVIDLLTLVEQLKKTGKLDAAGGVANVTSIVASAFTAAGANSHAKLVLEASQCRHALQALDSAAGLIRDGEQPIMDVIDTATSVLTGIVTRASNGIPAPAVAAQDWLDEYENRAEGKEPAGLATGYVDLDHNLHGIKPSELIYLAARPGMGKTALGLNLALNVASAGHATLFVSLEMDRSQILNRAIAVMSGIKGDKIQNPNHPADQERSKVMDAADKLSQLPLHVDDSASLTLADIRAKAKRMKVQQKLEFLVIDYLQYIVTQRDKNATKNDEIGEISRGLKALAKELKIPVLCLSQLNRNVEQRPDKRPLMSDLRDSGNIEQDADIVMFIYRDSYYHPDSSYPGLTELSVSKHRNGATGIVKLFFDAEKTNFIGLGKGEKPRAPGDFGGNLVSQSKMPF